MNKNKNTTFDTFMKNEDQKKKFDMEYSKFLLSEFLLKVITEEKMYIEKLSKESGIFTRKDKKDFFKYIPNFNKYIRI